MTQHISAAAPAPPRRISLGSIVCSALLSALLLLSCSRRETPPVLGSVPEFQLTDQAGKPISAQSLRGKPWVAAFMFTRCPSICPRITAYMRELQESANSADLAVRWVSFSVDPENDTPEILEQYAIKHGADLLNWSFVTGPSAAIRETAERGFKLAFEGTPDEKAPHFGLTHGSHLVLVDAAGQLRGYYSTQDGSSAKQLMAALRALQP